MFSISTDNSFRITRHKMLNSIELEKLAYCYTCSTCAIKDDLDILFFLSCDFECIDKTSKYDDRSTMLIIMHDRNIELSLESLFDLKTSWSRYIFEIDPSKSISNIFYRRDKFFDILSPDNDRKCIDSCKFLEEDTLPFHDWHRCLVPKISESENS